MKNLGHGLQRRSKVDIKNINNSDITSDMCNMRYNEKLGILTNNLTKHFQVIIQHTE